MNKYFFCNHCHKSFNLDVDDDVMLQPIKCPLCDRNYTYIEKQIFDEVQNKHELYFLLSCIFTLFISSGICIYLTLLDYNFWGAVSLISLLGLYFITILNKYKDKNVMFTKDTFSYILATTAIIVLPYTIIFNIFINTASILTFIIWFIPIIIITQIDKDSFFSAQGCGAFLCFIGAFILGAFIFNLTSNYFTDQYNELHIYIENKQTIYLGILCVLYIVNYLYIYMYNKIENKKYGLPIYELSMKESITAEENFIEKQQQYQLAEKETQLKEQHYIDLLESLKNKHGNYNKVINIYDKSNKYSNLNEQLIVFESDNYVYFQEKEYKMNDFLDCSLLDNSQIINGSTTATIKTRNGNIAKRAIIGDILLGGTGAIIGGATAKKDVTYSRTPDITIHDYKIVLNMNDFEKPIITINYGINETQAYYIMSIFSIIIKRGKELQS